MPLPPPPHRLPPEIQGRVDELAERLGRHFIQLYQTEPATREGTVKLGMRPPELIKPACGHTMMVQVLRGYIQDPGHADENGNWRQRWCEAQVCFDCGHATAELGKVMDP